MLRHLTPATVYSFTVKAFDESGNSTPSNTVLLTTPETSDVTPPSAPTNLHLEFDQGCAEVWLGWTQSTDDIDPQSAIEYEVYVNGVLSPLAVSAGIDRDFVYGTVNGDNTFTVEAVDQAATPRPPATRSSCSCGCADADGGISWRVTVSRPGGRGQA